MNDLSKYSYPFSTNTGSKSTENPWSSRKEHLRKNYCPFEHEQFHPINPSVSDWYSAIKLITINHRLIPVVSRLVLLLQMVV